MTRFAVKQTIERLDELARQIERCRETGDAESVHDLRVATRRLQSCLKTFGDFFPNRLVRKTERRLRRVRALAGRVRDCDIALGMASESGHPNEQLLRHLRDRRRAQAASLAAQLQRWPKLGSFERLRRSLRLHRASGDKTRRACRWDARRSAAANARKELPLLCSKFFRDGRKLLYRSCEDSKLHRFRIRAKRFRYALELFEPCYGKGLKKRLNSLKLLQEHLGAINDCRTTQALLNGDSAADEPDKGAAGFRSFVEKTAAQRRTAAIELWDSQFGPRKVERRWVKYLSR